MNSKQFYFFIGTTAELIKLAPVIREFKKRNIDYKIISSGQNVLNFEELEPIIGKESAYYKIKLQKLKFPLNTYLQFIIWMFKILVNFYLFFDNEFKGKNKKSIYFIVHGDTVSSMLGSIIAKFQRVKLVHLESGLRSFHFLEPFPEEICRYIVSNLATVHLCPNSWAINNLKKINGEKVNTYNNTLIETLQGILATKNSKVVKQIPRNKFFVLVLHRQEHMLFGKDRTRKLMELFTKITDKNLNCVLVLHKLTEDFLEDEKLIINIKANKNIHLVPRLPYPEFIRIMAKAEFIATDGGSNQEEAYYLGKPCLVLRRFTERIEGLGENVILSGGKEETIKHFLKNFKSYRRGVVRYKIAPSVIIVDYLMSH